MADTIPSAVLALLGSSPWYRASGRKPVQGHVYFEEDSDRAALFTFAEAERLMNEHAFRDQACAAFWPPPARVKVRSLAVRSLDNFLSDVYRAWTDHRGRLEAIRALYGPVCLSPEERAASRADWIEASRPTKGELEFRP
jgi:hypothetical protein